MTLVQKPRGGCEMCGGSVRTRKSGAWLCSKCHRQEERAQIETRPVTPQAKAVGRESPMERATAVPELTRASVTQAHRSAVEQMKHRIKMREERLNQVLASVGTTRFANHVNPVCDASGAGS